MSNTAAPVAPVAPKKEHGPVAKVLGTSAMLVLLAGVVTYVGMDEARKNASKTIQNIFDKDAALKPLKVESIFLPVQAGLPFADVLTSLGIVNRKMQGNFMISRKDGGKMGGNCTANEYDFTQSNRDGSYYYSIEGLEVAKLKVCSGALGNIFDDE